MPTSSAPDIRHLAGRTRRRGEAGTTCHRAFAGTPIGVEDNATAADYSTLALREDDSIVRARSSSPAASPSRHPMRIYRMLHCSQRDAPPALIRPSRETRSPRCHGSRPKPTRLSISPRWGLDPWVRAGYKHDVPTGLAHGIAGYGASDGQICSSARSKESWRGWRELVAEGMVQEGRRSPSPQS